MSNYDILNLMVARLKEEPQTIESLAAYLGKNARTIFRYLDKLHKSHVTVRKLSKGGHAQYYFIEDESRQLVTQEQIKGLTRMQQELAAGGNHKYTKMLATILKKMDPAQQSGATVIREHVSIDPHCHVDHGPFAEHKEYKSLVSKILDAVESHKELKIGYSHVSHQGDMADIGSSTAETFCFYPYKLVLRIGRLYLVGVRSDTPDELMILTLARVKTIATTGKFFGPFQLDIEEFYKYSVGQWVPRGALHKRIKPQNIVLTITAPWVVRQFEESNFNPPVQLSPQRDGTTQVKMIAYHTPDLENIIMSYLPGIQVVKPNSLANAIQARVSQVTPP